MGVLVAAHGEGMVERVRALVSESPDVIVDAAPVGLNTNALARFPTW